MALPSPSPSSRRSSCDSPEFEFNPSFPSPTSLHSADQLFFRGLLLPLHLLPLTNSDSLPLNPTSSSEIVNSVSAESSESAPPALAADPSPLILSAGITASKRWSHVFKKADKKLAPDNEDKSKNKESHKNRDKEKKREIRKSGANSAELNINLWPFSRSRSAGNNSGGGRTRTASAATRKVSSAPCSRSNSGGDSKTRRSWPVSPVRAGGVHLGRTSPVWQLPRTLSGKAAEKGKKEAGEVSRRSKAVKSAGGNTNKGRVLSLSVPMCIGYRHHLSCRSDEVSVAGGDSAGNSGGEDGVGAGGGSRISGGSGGNLFNLRSLFTKKVY